MSLAIAPPTVTKRVPGETGTNRPCGTLRRRIAVDAHPTGSRHRRRSVIDGERPRRHLVVEADHQSPAVLGAVAVAASEAASDGAAWRKVAHEFFESLGIAGAAADDRAGRRRRASPPGQQLAPHRHSLVGRNRPSATACVAGERISIRPLRSVPSQSPQHPADAECEQHLDADVAGEPPELGKLGDGVSSSAGRSGAGRGRRGTRPASGTVRRTGIVARTSTLERSRQ